LQDNDSTNPIETGDHRDLHCQHQVARHHERGICQDQRRHGCVQALDGFNQVGSETKAFIILDPSAASIHPELVVFLDLDLLEDQAQSSV